MVSFTYSSPTLHGPFWFPTVADVGGLIGADAIVVNVGRLLGPDVGGLPTGADVGGLIGANIGSVDTGKFIGP